MFIYRDFLRFSLLQRLWIWSYQRDIELQSPFNENSSLRGFEDTVEPCYCRVNLSF